MSHSSLCTRTPLRTGTLAPPNTPSRPSVIPRYPLRTGALAPPTIHCHSCVPARAGLGIMTMLPPMYPPAPAYPHPRPTDHPLPHLRTCPGGAWNYDNVAPYVSTRSYVPAPSPHRPSTDTPAYLPDPFYVAPHPFLRRCTTFCTYLFDKSF